MRLFLLFFLLYASVAWSQLTELTTPRGTTYQLFDLPDPAGPPIHFMVAGSQADLQKKKPLLLFLQGSLPRPLFLQDSTGTWALNMFAPEPYINEYHIVTVSKPGLLPLVDSLDSDLLVRDPKTGKFPAEYTSNNHLDYYVRTRQKVVDYLLEQPFIDPSRVVICGGSEGFRVGAALAAASPVYTHVILFSDSTLGRWQVEMQRVRLQAIRGEISSEAAQQAIERYYTDWKKLMTDPASTEKDFGDPYRTWYSFSAGNLDALLKITVPIYIAYGTDVYIAYGTDDYVNALSCDLLPIEFERRGKTNLTLRAWLDHDHTFFRTIKDSHGTATGKEYNGDTVAAAWFTWLRSH
jgi:pimeloyl-ACP methyl ester carboxylesterase